MADNKYHLMGKSLLSIMCSIFILVQCKAQDDSLTSKQNTPKRHHSEKMYHVDSIIYDFSKGDFININNEKNFTHNFYIYKRDRLKVIVTNINQLMYQTDLKLNARNITYDASTQDLTSFLNLVKSASKSPDSTAQQNALSALKSTNQSSSDQIQASVQQIGSTIDDLFRTDRVRFGAGGNVVIGNNPRENDSDSLNLNGSLDVSNANWTYYIKDTGYLVKNYPGYVMPAKNKNTVTRGYLLGTVKLNMIEMKRNVQDIFTYMNDTIFTFLAQINQTRNSYYSLISQVSKATQSNLSYNDAVSEILRTIQNFLPKYSYGRAFSNDEYSLNTATYNFNIEITRQVDSLFASYKSIRARIEDYSNWLKWHTDLMSRLYYPFSFSDTIGRINSFVDSTVKSTLFQMDTIYNNTIEYIGKVKSGIVDFIRFAKGKQNFEIISSKDDIDADKVNILFQAIPRSEFSSQLLSKYVKALNYDTLAVVQVKNGIVINVSTGFFWNFGLADRKYRLDTFFTNRNGAIVKTDSVQINYAKSNNQYLPSFGALLHVYKRTLTDVSWGGAFGLSVNTDGSYSAYLGLSFLIGKQQRFIISGGLAGARIKYLSSAYQVGDLLPVSRQIQAQDLPSEDVYRFGGFASITFNLSSIAK